MMTLFLYLYTHTILTELYNAMTSVKWSRPDVSKFLQVQKFNKKYSSQQSSSDSHKIFFYIYM